ncbi:hypothetical protein [Variovorax soli]|uniref:hypothetical protein n=1 Tax=Variovorax soli TaxID=376815 RepID=UPI0012947396|nr:hypothetical protein [Variovorax soli]
MKSTEVLKARSLIVEFATLSEAGKTQFFSSINRFMLASPKKRREILEEWERHSATAAQKAQRAKTDSPQA